MQSCLIAFGSNQGDRLAVLESAISEMRTIKQLEIRAVSSPLLTPAVGGSTGQSKFVNAAIRIETSLDPKSLHQYLIRIEGQLGRTREDRWEARVIDLDLLLYGHLQQSAQQLTIPHPRMTFRRFVLVPSKQIAGDMVHSLSGLTISQLIDHLDASPQQLLWATGNRTFARVVTTKLVSQPTAFGQTMAVAEFPAADSIWKSPDRSEQSTNSTPANVWTIRTVDRREQFEAAAPTAKLVVYDAQEPNALTRELVDKAARFPGPTLNLAQCDAEHAVSEIRAAIDAMMPL